MPTIENVEKPSFQVLSLDEIRMKKGKKDEKQSQPDSTTMKKEEIEDLRSVTQVVEESRSRPIRLKRSFTTSSLENTSRVRLKRSKMSDNATVSSTNSEPIVPDDLMMIELSNQSPLSEDMSSNRIAAEDDLLKDIDALLED